MQLSQLEGRRVALWGFGREGLAAWRAIRARWPQQSLTVFCPAVEHAEVAALGDPQLQIAGEPDAAALAAFEIVIKSPGISAYRPALLAAREQGVEFSSGTALWFAAGLPGLKLCITGTKGKSSTTALAAHLLRSRGLAVGLAGNIGLPLLELIDPPLPPAVWAIELSSYQTADAAQPDVAVVLNLYPEHLDWHGSEARYIADKLALIESAAPQRRVLNWLDPRLRALGESLPDTRWFGREDGWHVRAGAIHCADRRVLEGDRLPLPGEHNLLNACAALAAIDALGFDGAALAPAAQHFRCLPHRLQRLGERDGRLYVNDSISTTPHASLAALRCYAGRPVAVIVGGFDRGLPWEEFAAALDELPVARVITRGQNGARIAELLRKRAPRQPVVEALSLDEAIAAARQALPSQGVVLLSPGAPSFGEFRNYAERGEAFARAAGFDGDRSGRIEGLGIH